MMSMIRGIALFASALAITSAVIASAEPHHGSSLCRQGEHHWIDAQVEGGAAVISLCGSDTLKGPGSWLQFRHLPSENASVYTYPATQAQSTGAFKFHRSERDGKTVYVIEFRDGGERYALADEYHPMNDATRKGASGRVSSLIISGGDLPSDPASSRLELLPSSPFHSLAGLENRLR